MFESRRYYQGRDRGNLERRVHAPEGNLPPMTSGPSPYEIRLSERSRREIRKIVKKYEYLADPILDRQNELRQHPATLSRPTASPPYPPGFQVFEFSIRSEDIKHRVSFFFKYSEDETAIFIAFVGHIEHDL